MMNNVDHIYILEDLNAFTHMVIYFEENVTPTPEQVNRDFEIIREMAANEEFFLVVDLSRTNPPSIEVRKTLKRNFNSLKDQLLKVFIFTGKNKFMNIAAKFVFSSAGIKNFILFTTREQTINSIPRKSS